MRWLVVGTLVALAACGRIDFSLAHSDGSSPDDDARSIDTPHAIDATVTQTIAVQQHAFSLGGVAPYQVAFATNVTAGDLILLGYDFNATSTTDSSVTDSMGNSFTVANEANDPSGPGTVGIAYAISATSGPDNLIFSPSVSTGYVELRANELSGVVPIGSLDTVASVAGMSTAIDGVATTVTTAGVDELAVVVCIEFSGGSPHPGTNMTEVSTDDGDLVETGDALYPGVHTFAATLDATGDAVMVTAVFHGQ